VRRLGGFPSRTALADADGKLSEVLTRLRAPGGATSAAEVSSLLRQRAQVRLASGSEGDALRDLDDALEICRGSFKQSAVQFEEMPQVHIARAEIYARQARLELAVRDLDAAAELLGEPLEDIELVRDRGRVRKRLGRNADAAEDFGAAAELLRRVGRRPEAEIEAELQAVALLAAGQVEAAEQGLVDVIRRCVGLLSEDVALLQRVVIADSDARLLMAAIAWHSGREEIAETYWRDGCDRIDILKDEAGTKRQVVGYPFGDVYGCVRYTNSSWLTIERLWPESAVGWLQEFLSNRPAKPPRDSYVQDLMVGRRPGDGSTLVDLAIATDVFRRANPVEDLQANMERSGMLDSRVFK